MTRDENKKACSEESPRGWPVRDLAFHRNALQIEAMKIAAAQIACTPGDLEANLRTINDFASPAKDAGAELIVFPEMIDTGYSMPVIQKHATSWTEGAVPQLQE